MFNGACETVFVIGEKGAVRVNKSDFDPATMTECDDKGNALGSNAEDDKGATFGVVERDGRWYVTTASGTVSKAKRFEQAGYETEVAAWTATTA